MKGGGDLRLILGFARYVVATVNGKKAVYSGCLLCYNSTVNSKKTISSGESLIPFIGRSEELQGLKALQGKSSSSLVVITGRRRIGKSTLVGEFSKNFKHYYEFQGMAPRQGLTNEDQLKNFAEQCKQILGGVEPVLNNWTEAFSYLASNISTQKSALLFIDEVSWMARYDKDFVGKLKIAWDTKFSRIPGLVLVLCGSVSSWIEDNILQETDFIGRVSLTIRLTELDLKDSLNFWGERGKNISLKEKLSYLNVVGGVPKYLEEYNPRESTNSNILRLCFKKGGYLFEDFEKIFSDIFERKSETYKKIVRLLAQRHLSPVEVSKALKVKQSGELTKCLRDLELSGFIKRDYTYQPGGKRGRLSKLRISDNYLRFYLKYIEPNITAINSGLYNFSSLGELLAWEAISGLQFENLLLNRVPEVIKVLGLEREVIKSAGTYFQNKTNKSEAVQVDLFIECKPNNFYICEIKYKKKIGLSIVGEVREKIEKLKLPKYSTRRPVLIYSGELDPEVRELDYFDLIVEVGEVN